MSIRVCSCRFLVEQPRFAFAFFPNLLHDRMLLTAMGHVSMLFVLSAKSGERVLIALEPVARAA